MYYFVIVLCFAVMNSATVVFVMQHECAILVSQPNKMQKSLIMVFWVMIDTNVVYSV